MPYSNIKFSEQQNEIIAEHCKKYNMTKQEWVNNAINDRIEFYEDSEIWQAKRKHLKSNK
jgi:predicted transglutaminase-like cysteine proteinase